MKLIENYSWKKIKNVISFFIDHEHLNAFSINWENLRPVYEELKVKNKKKLGGLEY